MQIIRQTKGAAACIFNAAAPFCFLQITRGTNDINIHANEYISEYIYDI